jgi:hypothetical protein
LGCKEVLDEGVIIGDAGAGANTVWIGVIGGCIWGNLKDGTIPDATGDVIGEVIPCEEEGFESCLAVRKMLLFTLSKLFHMSLPM